MVASRTTMNCATAMSASTARASTREAGPGTGPAAAMDISSAVTPCPSCSSVCSSVAVTAVAELVDESLMGRRPIELGASPGRVRPLIEQQDLGEVVTQACSRLVVGTRDRARGADCDGRRLGYLGDSGVQSIANHVVTAGRVVLQGTPVEIREV